jgi:hypothetical protein
MAPTSSDFGRARVGPRLTAVRVHQAPARRSTVALLLLLSAPAVPLGAQPPDAPIVPSGPCTRVVDGDGRPAAETIAWSARTRPSERRALDRHCGTLGSIVLIRQPAPRPVTSSDAIAIVSWNVHVGGGDLSAVIDGLESGTLTGEPAPHYVLLLQEAYRAGGDVPPGPPGVGVPRRIAPKVAGRVREDIVTIARRRGLALYYAPSMRNGRNVPFEDRGNAILSTVALEDPAAVELPFTRQRRVALGARIGGRAPDGRPWSLRLATVHLDALAGASRLWVFAHRWRARQAQTVIGVLDRDEPSVVGGDLNTWLLGRWESAARCFAAAIRRRGRP